jgi:hypothetical protein
MDWILLPVIVVLWLPAFAMAIWSPELLTGASGSVIVPLVVAGAALGIAIASTTRLGVLNPHAPRVARTTAPRIIDRISAVWIVASSALCTAGLLFAALTLPPAKAETPLVGTTIAILAAGILTLAITLSESETQSPPILIFILAITVVQVLLQLSLPGKRFLRLWPELAEGL